jgi:phosphonate metabolism protein PhnN/1,5-bisphosphokinase (PRPP-forming)
MVCGPSGAGKDSVIAWAQDALREHPRICFAQRLVTRAPQSAGHEAVSVAGIEALRRRGALAWHWQAHGLHYGVRAEYAQRVADGEVVVVNGSREHATPLAGRADVRCILLTASPGLLHERLARRGREDATAVATRLARNAVLAPLAADRVIANDADLSAAGAALRDYLLELTR